MAPRETPDSVCNVFFSLAPVSKQPNRLRECHVNLNVNNDELLQLDNRMLHWSAENQIPRHSHLSPPPQPPGGGLLSGALAPPTVDFPAGRPLWGSCTETHPQVKLARCEICPRKSIARVMGVGCFSPATRLTLMHPRSVRTGKRWGSRVSCPS